jgi:hypothetical protein
MKKTAFLCLSILLLLNGGYNAQSQSFELLGGMDPETNQLFNFWHIKVSENERVLLGAKVGETELTLVVDGIEVPLTLPENSSVINLSGDGSTIIGTQRLTHCQSTSCNRPFYYRWETQELVWLPVPNVGDPTKEHCRSLYVSHDGQIISGLFEIETGYQYVTTHVFRWENGLRETISEFTKDRLDVYQYNLRGYFFHTLAGMDSIGSILFGIGYHPEGRGPRPLIYDGSFRFLSIFPPGAQYYRSINVLSSTPDASVLVGWGMVEEVAFEQPAIWTDSGTRVLEMLGLHPTKPASEARYISYDGKQVFSFEDGLSSLIESRWTVWSEEEGVRTIIDAFKDEYGFDLNGLDGKPDEFTVSGVGPNHTIYGYGSYGYGLHREQRRAWKAVLVPLDKQIVVNSILDHPNLPTEPTLCKTGNLINIDGNLVPECTLRAALEVAAARGGENPITFNIPGSGPHTISLQSMLPEVPAQTMLDATTQPGFETAPFIAINGSNAISTAFTLTQDESTIRGFSIGGFTGAGIAIAGGNNNQVEHCFIGVAPDGVTPNPNGEGIIIQNGIGNHIGNIEGESANQISANLGNGIVITGEDSRENIVVTNYIGTDISGNTPLPNQGHGIAIDNAPENTIGSAEMKLRNLISGNQESGILITGTEAVGNRVLGNYIGVNVDGTQALANGSHGIFIEEGASQTIIGGSTTTAGTSPGNVISGNTAEGIKIVAPGEQTSKQNKISGNIIGLNATGTAALPNGEKGILLIGRVTEIEIGGPTPSHGNVVSGHSEYQIELIDEADEVSPAAPYIANNIVGLSITGNTTIKPMSIIGIKLGGAGRLFTEIGVPDFRIEDNLVAGNNAQIYVLGELSANGEISGNTLGLFRNGNIALPDSSAIGLWIQGATHLRIGQPDKGNIIGGNIIGLLLGANFSQVNGNHIGVNAAGNLARANAIGVLIPGEIKEGSNTLVTPTGMSNIIGIQLDEDGNIEEGRNIISGNKRAGISIIPEFGGSQNGTGDKMYDVMSRLNLPKSGLKALEEKYLKDNTFAPADSNIIGGNYIGLSASGGSLGNGKNRNEDERSGGVEITRGRGNYIIHNHIGDNGFGIAVYRNPDFLFGPGNTYISGNTIGTRMSGTNMMPRPNQSHGIVHLASSHLYIGINPENPFMQNPNVIAHNDDFGVFISRYADTEPGESNVTLRGNAIANNKMGAYLVARNMEMTGGDLDGVPYPPYLHLITVDSAVVNISGKAPEPGQVDFYTGVPDHYDEDAISTRYYKKTIIQESMTGFDLSEIPEVFSVNEGDYLSATLNIAPVDGFFMTSHFSPAIRVAKKENTIIKVVETDEMGELMEGWGIGVSREDNAGNSEKSTLANESTSGSLYLAFHELAPEFNIFSGQALSANGETLIEPDSLLLPYYYTLTTDALSTNNYQVCIALPDTKSSPDLNEMLLVQRYRTGAPWYALETVAGSQPNTLCARGLYSMGDFSIGFHAGISTNTHAPIFSNQQKILYNYPNPFQNETTIILHLQRDGDTFVRLLDVQGRLVKEIFQGHLPNGEHQFHLSSQGLTPGIYIIQAGNAHESHINKVMVGR